MTENKRTQQLTFLSILSFIGGGLSLLSNLILWLLFDEIKNIFKDGAAQKMLGTDIDMGFLLDLNPDFFLWQILFYGISIYGVYLMWNLQMKGFHFYSLAQILLLILPEVYLPFLPFPFFEIALTIVFILLYFKNLKEVEKS